MREHASTLGVVDTPKHMRARHPRFTDQVSVSVLAELALLELMEREAAGSREASLVVYRL